MAYPSVVTTLTNPNPTDRLNSPSHSGIETAQNTEITALETFVGTISSTAGSLVFDIRSSNSDGGGHVQSAVKGGTGQTAFTKGDLLVGQSNSVLSRLAVGANNAIPIADSTAATGIRWAANPAGGIPTVRIYSTPSTLTWVKPSVLSYIAVGVQAAGAGAAGVNAGSGGQGAGAGGAGAYAWKIYTASVLSNTSLTVGALGTGGAAGANNGTAGGNSTFAATSSILCTGGGAGDFNGPGGAGGVATGGDININGQEGGSGGSGLPPSGGGGGNSFLGNGAQPIYTSGNGTNGTGFGSGGSAGVGTSTTRAGGNGTNGIVVIMEY